MQRIKRTTVAFAALVVAFTLAPAAGATGQPDQKKDYLDKSEYAPGGAIKVALDGALLNCGMQVTSAGFAAPIALRPVPTATIGEGTAAETPGTYEARIFCKWGSLVDSFTITAPVTTTTPPAVTTTTPPPVATTKPAPTQQPKPPVKKPKGAPQTGGGGTA